MPSTKNKYEVTKADQTVVTVEASSVEFDPSGRVTFYDEKGSPVAQFVGHQSFLKI